MALVVLTEISGATESGTPPVVTPAHLDISSDANSGFVQAIYINDVLVKSGVPTGVTYTQYTGGESFQLSKGTPLPNGARISNRRVGDRIRVVINHHD